MKNRNTKQYLKTYQIVCESCNHPTALEVYQQIVQIFPNISLTTVYRNLNKLAKEGKIQHILIPNQPDRFDRTTQDHYHLHCIYCNQFVDLSFPYQSQLNHLVENASDYQIMEHSIIFNGICPSCRKKINQKVKGA